VLSENIIKYHQTNGNHYNGIFNNESQHNLHKTVFVKIGSRHSLQYALDRLGCLNISLWALSDIVLAPIVRQQQQFDDITR